MNRTTPFLPARWRRYNKLCAAGLLSLLPVVVQADGAPEELSRAGPQAAGEMGPAGTLRTVGTYPFNLKGHTVTGLADGRVFVYGADPMDTQDAGVDNDQVLRRRRDKSARGAS